MVRRSSEGDDGVSPNLKTYTEAGNGGTETFLDLAQLARKMIARMMKRTAFSLSLCRPFLTFGLQESNS